MLLRLDIVNYSDAWMSHRLKLLQESRLDLTILDARHRWQTAHAIVAAILYLLKVIAISW